MIKDIVLDEFQNTVSDLLIYNKSILDAMAKIQESDASLHKSVIKSVTRCGCIEIKASKADIPSDATLADLKQIMDSHIKGSLCPTCKENIEKSVGQMIFYTTALCNLLDLNMCDILLKKQKNMKLLGYYSLA